MVRLGVGFGLPLGWDRKSGLSSRNAPLCLDIDVGKLRARVCDLLGACKYQGDYASVVL